jgi:hypothetical protein
LSGGHDQEQSSDDIHWVPQRWLIVILALLAAGLRRFFRLLVSRSNHKTDTGRQAAFVPCSPNRGTHGTQRIAPPPSQRRMTKHYFLVVVLILAAGGAGIAHAASRPTSFLGEGNLSSCIAPVKAAEHLTVYSSGQTISFDLKETVTLKLATSIARKLAQEASTNNPFYNLCYFPGFDKTAAFTSSDKGLVTFSNEISTQNDIPSLLRVSGWYTTLHDGLVELDFQSTGFCHPGPDSLLPEWNGTQFTATVTTSDSVRNLSSLPTNHSGDNYAWSFAKLDCKNPSTFKLSTRVPLVTYTNTRILDSTSLSPTWINLLNLLFNILLLLAGVVIWALNRRFTQSAPRMVFLLTISSLGLAATFFYGRTDALPSAAILFGIYGVILAIVIRGRLWFRLGVGAITIGLAVAAIVYHSHHPITFDIQGSADTVLFIEALVAILMLSSGILAFKRLRAWLHGGYIGRTTQERASRRLDIALLYSWALAAVAVSYSLGDVQAPNDILNLARSEINVPEYALYPFTFTLVAAALVLPLIERGNTTQQRQLWGGIIGFSFLAQLPDPSFAVSAIPIAEIIFTTALIRITARRAPQRDLTSTQSRLRTCVPLESISANILLAAKIAVAIAVVPVAYFAYTALTNIPRNLEFEGGAITVAAGIIDQAIGWILIGVVFSVINNRLPGGSGPIRAVIVSALWFTVGAIAFIVDTWLRGSLGRSWTFFGLQLFLFLLTFSAVWDACILGKLSWSSLDQLRDAYSLQRVRTVALYAAPLLLALIALGQQVISGSGVHFVQSALTAVPSIFGK